MILEAQNLKKSYGKREALKGINFSLGKGEIMAFLGPNGAGKSTTIKIIMGLRRPDSGALKLFGKLGHTSEIKNKLGYTSQDLTFPGQLKIKELLKFVASHYLNPLPLGALIDRFDLRNFADSKVGGLSGGEKRRLGLACALIGQPEILILDEPTTGLDVESRRILWREIENFKKQGGSILLSTHDLNEVEAIASRILVIDQGQILMDGTLPEIQKQIDYQRIHFEVPEAGGFKKVTEITQDTDAFVKRLAVHQPQFRNLHIDPITLEEAFLKLRGKL